MKACDWGASIAVRRPVAAPDMPRVPAKSANMLWVVGGLARELAKHCKSLNGELISRLLRLRTQETKVRNFRWRQEPLFSDLK